MKIVKDKIVWVRKEYSKVNKDFEWIPPYKFLWWENDGYFSIDGVNAKSREELEESEEYSIRENIVYNNARLVFSLADGSIQCMYFNSDRDMNKFYNTHLIGLNFLNNGK